VNKPVDSTRYNPVEKWVISHRITGDAAVDRLEQVVPDTRMTQFVPGCPGFTRALPTGFADQANGVGTGLAGLIHLSTAHNKSTTTLIQR